MRTTLLGRFMLFVVTATLMVCGCSDSTAPVTPAAESDNGWQLVIEYNGSESGRVIPVAGFKTDVFATLSLDDFSTARQLVIELPSRNSVAQVGYAVSSTMYAQNFQGSSSVTWSFSGNMAPAGKDSTKVQIGSFSSLYAMQELDTNFNYGDPSFGSYALSSAGDDFLMKEQIKVKDLYYMDMSVVFYRPVVCAEFAARKITSSGVTEVQSDNSHRLSGKYVVGDLTITCNPKLPSAGATLSRAVPAEKPVKLTDYIRAHRGVLR